MNIPHISMAPNDFVLVTLTQSSECECVPFLSPTSNGSTTESIDKKFTISRMENGKALLYIYRRAAVSIDTNEDRHRDSIDFEHRKVTKNRERERVRANRQTGKFKCSKTNQPSVIIAE